MTSRSNPVKEGHYARKQIYCPSRIISWSHRARFKMGRKLVSAQAGGRLLDYGCGDGTFVFLVRDLFTSTMATDRDSESMADCRRRFSGIGSLSFCDIGELKAPRYRHYFDVVSCLEVLEHCADGAVEEVLADLERWMAPSGRIVISVPIEVGPSLILKQAVRALAGWRRLGHYQYRETYSLTELWRAGWAKDLATLERSAYGQGKEQYHGHKGFDWRILQKKLELRFQIEEARFSPLNLLGRHLNSQVWFVCHRKPGLCDNLIPAS